MIPDKDVEGQEVKGYGDMMWLLNESISGEVMSR